MRTARAVPKCSTSAFLRDGPMPGTSSSGLPVIALLISFLIAGIVALLLMALGKIKLGGSMALGPYLIAGFFGAITVGAWS